MFLSTYHDVSFYRLITLEKQPTFMILVIGLMGVHMLFPNTLAIHGCGIVYVLVVELMEVSVILILTRVSCILFNLGHNYSKSLIFTYCECSFNIDNIKVNKFIVHVN